MGALQPRIIIRGVVIGRLSDDLWGALRRIAGQARGWSPQKCDDHDPQRVNILFVAANADTAAQLMADVVEWFGSHPELFEPPAKSNGPLCLTCGINMRPAGAAWVCENCGNFSDPGAEGDGGDSGEGGDGDGPATEGAEASSQRDYDDGNGTFVSNCVATQP